MDVAAADHVCLVVTGLEMRMHEQRPLHYLILPPIVLIVSMRTFSIDDRSWPDSCSNFAPCLKSDENKQV